MIKYVDYQVVFKEIPDEITLAINISGCPNHCKGCHSQYLSKDIGIILNSSELFRILDNNSGITCVSFMGGDQSPVDINNLALDVKSRNLKVGWYSGKEFLSEDINLNNFDYIKLGPYIEELGPLNCPTTNQKLYQISNDELLDITYKLQ